MRNEADKRCKSRSIFPSPTPLGKSLSLESGYEEWVQIKILIPLLPPWVNHSDWNQGMRNGTCQIQIF
jgi:hypothetical protein